jgi:hypothetical protein
MYAIKAYAVRLDKTIQVTINGYLANSCYTTGVVNKYPGGTIFYVQDPGSAQVLIEETYIGGDNVCTLALVPWFSHVNIIDSAHDKVEIYVNGNLELTIGIEKEVKEYRVIALTASSAEKYLGCSVIPKNAIYPAIYSSVFGPDSKDKCTKWLVENCKVLDHTPLKGLFPKGEDAPFPLG